MRKQAGDTLIEVLFAVTVFSLIVVTALALMNQGVATSQRALETSLVRQQMDSQTETLRFLHDAYVASYQAGYSSGSVAAPTGAAGQFYAIVQDANASKITSASALNDGSITCARPQSGSFVLNTRTATVVKNPLIFKDAETFAQLKYSASAPTVLDASEGVWIEPVRSGDSGEATQLSGYIDFHVRACWSAPGLQIPMRLGSIVRLYEPRN